MKDANGNYIFKVDGSAVVSWSALKFTNLSAYDGKSNVIVQFTGTSDINFSNGGTVLNQAAQSLGNGKLFLSVSGAQLIDLSNSQAPDVTLLAPNSNIVTTTGKYSGIIGCFNGTADPSNTLNPGDDGYPNPGDGSDTLTNNDDPTTTTKTQTITKTFHFVDQDGNTIHSDVTANGLVTADVSSDGTISNPTSTTISYPGSLPIIKGYTTPQTPQPTKVTYGDSNPSDETIVYTSTAITRTIHIQDDFGNTLAKDVVLTGKADTTAKNRLTFTTTTQPAFDGYSTTPTFWTADGKQTQVNPFTAKEGTASDGNEVYTVKYAKNPVPFTVKRTVTTKFGDGVEGDATKLPAPTTKSETLYIDENGNISTKPNGATIAHGDPFGTLTSAKAPKLESYTNADGTTFTYTGTYDNEGLDNQTITDGIKAAAKAGTEYDYNVSFVYYPSSTSKTKTLKFENEVFFDYADDDYDSDPAQLPEKFTRTATVSYLETTDSQGHRSYSNWKINEGLPALTDANVPAMAGYETNVENDISDEAILGMLKAMGPITGGSVTAETQITYQRVPQIPDSGIHVYEKSQVPDEAPSVSQDDYYDHTTAGNTGDGIHVLEKSQVPDEAPSVSQDDYYDHTTAGNTGDGIHVLEKSQVPDEAPSVTADDYYDHTTAGNTGDGIHVLEKSQVPDEAPSVSQGDYYDHTTAGNTGDGIHVLEKSQVPDEAPSVTADDYYDHTTAGNTGDGIHVLEKSQVPDEAPSVSQGDYYDHTTAGNTGDGIHVYEKSQVPDEAPSVSQDDYYDHTTAGNTGDGIHVLEKSQVPDEAPSVSQGDYYDHTTTTTTPSDNAGQTTTSTTPSGDAGQTTTTTPSGDDGQITTTTTPSGNNGQTTTTTTPSGNGGQTTITTTPSVDAGQTTTTTTPSGSLTTNVGTPANAPATTQNATGTTPQANGTQTRTGNGLTGQTPTTDITTTNGDGTTSRTLTYVDATQAPATALTQADQAPTPSDNAQAFDVTKADAIPDHTAVIADQADAPAVDDAANSVSVVANVLDVNAENTGGNIFTAGGAPGMADYTFFSQPVMDSATNSVDHYELLLRVWDSKQGGWHLPASFSIPASMEAHLMARAVAQLDVKDISINLTDAQFEDPDTQKAITDLAQSDAVDSLTVELATIPDSDQLATNAKVFQAAGVKVTLDNLGSHTDGTQLANAADHVDTLKVSLRGMRRDGNNLTQMTNQLAAWQKAAAAHDDSLEVEDLETPEDLAMTNDLGITAVQGYYFSRPAMPGTRADLM